MHGYFSWIMHFDPTTRAALITAAATLFSVMAAVFGVLMKLRWDRKKHTREHLLNLRRDVYLSAADTISAAVQSLVSLADPSVNVEDGRARVSALGGVVGKIHLLGDRRTIKAILALLQGFTGAYARILFERSFFQWQEKQTQIDSNAAELAELEKQRDRAKAENQQETVALLSRDISRLHTLGIKTFREVMNKRLSLLTLATEKIVSLEPLFSEFILALKADLRLQIDEKWYREEAKASSAKANEILRPIMNKIQQLDHLLENLGQMIKPSEKDLGQLSSPRADKID